MKINPIFLENSVVVIDVETTGLDPARDSIIEIGMVRIEKGELCDEYSCLFDPGRPIPEEITNLTNIKTKDCEGQPFFRDKIGEISGFLGHDNIAAHNAPFDIRFIKNEWKKTGTGHVKFPKAGVIDTLELSRILLPEVPTHKLAYLLNYLNIKEGERHRALSDARDTALLLLELLKKIETLDAKALHIINRLLRGNPSPAAEIFGLAEKNAKNSGRKLSGRRFGSLNIIGKQNPHKNRNEIEPISENFVDEFFAPIGFLSQIFEFYEPRFEQQELARLTTRAFNRNEFLVVEAGTGVGKSLGYLVPAVLWAEKNNSDRIIISTNTKNLQDQLFYKDLPPLMKGRSIKAVLLKGRANYLCPLRWEHMINEGYNYLTEDMRKSLLYLVVWAVETETGDIEESPGFRNRYTDILWSQLNADSVQCKRNRCPYFSNCFYQKVKNSAATSNIVIVNHSLLFSDSASEHQILGPYSTLIIDEAHNAESSASSCLTTNLTLWNFLELDMRLNSRSGTSAGIIPLVREFIRDMKDENGLKDSVNSINTIEEASEELKEQARRFFDSVLLQSDSMAKDGTASKVRIRNSNDLPVLSGEEQNQIKRLILRIIKNIERLTELLETYASPEPELYNIIAELESLTTICTRIKEKFTYFTSDIPDSDVVWVEIKRKAKEPRADFYSVPLNIGDLLANTLYPGLDRCVMTSATMRVGRSFDYIIGRLGLNAVDPDLITIKHLGSPFRFDEQSLMIIPSYMPGPKDRNFTQATASFLEELIKRSPRGTLVLFTSYTMLLSVHNYLKERFLNGGILLLAQGRNASRRSLLEQFRKSEKSVLLATSSFWEGIDVPGSSLEQLVIVKLPFSMPTEPVVEARTEEVQKNTGNGFINYSVPEAVVRLRQGAGRLIRSERDRGVVIFLDKRLVTTSYGGIFVSSFPAPVNVLDNSDKVFKSISDWFENS
ncbi:hypothetical protein J7K93_00830 [bacterium]|nr:hypothetical protein [bacterium]